MDIRKFWKAVLRQDRDAIREYFQDTAYVNWHCTNEHFTLDEYLRANCDYPGQWDGEVERVEAVGDMVITVTHVFLKDRSASFHVVSFLAMENGKIQAMDEYWADDGDAPQWRREMGIGTPLCPLCKKA